MNIKPQDIKPVLFHAVDAGIITPDQASRIFILALKIEECECSDCYTPPFEVCHFCGQNNQPIHIESEVQYGEPVCTVCFVKSFVPDP